MHENCGTLRRNFCGLVFLFSGWHFQLSSQFVIWIVAPCPEIMYTKAIVNLQNSAATGWQRRKSCKTFCTFIILKYRSYNLSRVLSVTYATCNVDLQNIHCSSLKSEVKKSQSIHFTWKGSPVHYIWTIFKIFTCFRISASKISSHYITCVI